MASGFGDMQSLLKQAQDMQRRMQETTRLLHHTGSLVPSCLSRCEISMTSSTRCQRRLLSSLGWIVLEGSSDQLLENTLQVCQRYF